MFTILCLGRLDTFPPDYLPFCWGFFHLSFWYNYRFTGSYKSRKARYLCNILHNIKSRKLTLVQSIDRYLIVLIRVVCVCVCVYVFLCGFIPCVESCNCYHSQDKELFVPSAQRPLMYPFIVAPILLPSSTPSCPNPWQPLRCSSSLSFKKYYINEIIYLTFGVFFFFYWASIHLEIHRSWFMCQSCFISYCSVVFPGMDVPKFLSPLTSIHPLKDVWVVLNFLTIADQATMNICV